MEFRGALCTECSFRGALCTECRVHGDTTYRVQGLRSVQSAGLRSALHTECRAFGCAMHSMQGSALFHRLSIFLLFIVLLYYMSFCPSESTPSYFLL